VIETASGKLLPDAIDRTRAASVAWKPDNSGFFYTRYPRKGDVPEGQEVYSPLSVFYHALGSDPGARSADFRRRPRSPEWWPNVSPLGRRTLAADRRGAGLDEDEMFLQDLTSKSAPVEITAGQGFSLQRLTF
jgi:Tol biopolymer transport system component